MIKNYVLYFLFTRCLTIEDKLLLSKKYAEIEHFWHILCISTHIKDLTQVKYGTVVIKLGL